MTTQTWKMTGETFHRRHLTTIHLILSGNFPFLSQRVVEKSIFFIPHLLYVDIPSFLVFATRDSTPKHRTPTKKRTPKKKTPKKKKVTPQKKATPQKKLFVKAPSPVKSTSEDSDTDDVDAADVSRDINYWKSQCIFFKPNLLPVVGIFMCFFPEKCHKRGRLLRVMEERYRVHRQKCKKAKKDIKQGKVELLPKCGFYVFPREQEEFLKMK